MRNACSPIAHLLIFALPSAPGVRVQAPAPPTIGAEEPMPKKHGQEEGSRFFGLPNGLEVRARHLANTGLVSARLTFSWTEGDGGAPLGTAWLLSRVLPFVGSGGLDRSAFRTHCDRSGVLIQMGSGRDSLSWTVCARPANADLMFQILADLALRPAWSGTGSLPEIMLGVHDGRSQAGAREGAFHDFRLVLGDPALAQPPEEGTAIDQDTVIALWSQARRPERAVLSVAGEVESISLLRSVNQNFAPWEGLRDGVAPGMDGQGQAAMRREMAGVSETDNRRPTKPAWPGRVVSADGGPSEVWLAWGSTPPRAAIGVDAPGRPRPPIQLMPWLLREALPPSDEAIAGWETDPGGLWLRAFGRDGLPADRLESHIKTLLHRQYTQEQLDRALRAREEHIRAKALHPLRALEEDTPFTAPTLEGLNRAVETWMGPECMAVLVLGG